MKKLVIISYIVLALAVLVYVCFGVWGNMSLEDWDRWFFVLIALALITTVVEIIAYIKMRKNLNEEERAKKIGGLLSANVAKATPISLFLIRYFFTYQVNF